MRIVVDAQLVSGYFREDVLDEGPPYTGSMKAVIDKFGIMDVGCIDADGHIEQEYREVVDPDWFEAWFGERLEVGDFVSVPVASCADLIRKLTNDFGFPKRGRDRRYVALARTLVERENGSPVLLSEDLDFYSPKEKKAGAKRRAALLKGHKAPVATYLRKQEGILVRSVGGHLAARAA